MRGDKHMYTTQEISKAIREYYRGRAKEMIETELGIKFQGDKSRCSNYLRHKNKDKSPSMGWHEKEQYAHCFTCGMTKNVIDIALDKVPVSEKGKAFVNLAKEAGLEYMLEGATDNKPPATKSETFQTKEEDFMPLSIDQIEYLASRGISEKMIELYDIKSYQFINENGQRSGTQYIAFLYKDQYNKIIGAKLRAPGQVDKKMRFRAVDKSSYNLFGQNNLRLNGKGKDRIFITEGEIDAITVAISAMQLGKFVNVVSIPSGATTRQTLMDNRDILDKFDEIVVLSDNDTAGEEMDAVFRELFKDKATFINKALMTEKDINAEFLQFGAETVLRLICSVRLDIEGYANMSDLSYPKPNGYRKYIPTSIEQIDEKLNDLMTGEVVVVAGEFGSGKTTLVSEIERNAIEYGHKVFRVDGESYFEEIQKNAYRNLLAGYPEHIEFIQENKKMLIAPKPYAFEAMQRWHKDKWHVFCRTRGELRSLDELFNMVARVVKSQKIDLVVLDNLMSLLEINSSDANLNEAQATFMKRCIKIADIHNCCILLVAHTNKNAASAQKFHGHQIMGASAIPNYAHTILHVSINKDDKEKKLQGIDGTITIGKNRREMDCGIVHTTFDKKYRRLFGYGQEQATVFSWTKYLPEQFKITDNQEKEPPKPQTFEFDETDLPF